MVERVKSISAYHIFQPLEEAYGHDIPTFNKIVFFILMLYTYESPHVRLAGAWEQTKIALIDELGIDDPAIQHDLLDMQTDGFAETVARYLDSQQAFVWEHLVTLQELYNELRRSARSRIMKGENVDYDQKIKNMKAASEMADEIAKYTQLARKEMEEKASRQHAEADARTKRETPADRFTLRVEDKVKELRQRAKQKVIKEENDDDDDE